MSRAFPALNEFSDRTLNLLGSIFGGRDVRVVLSSRASNPATVALESRTVVLDPQRTGLYDLALAARMLQHRLLRKSGPKDPDRLDAWLTRKAQRSLAAKTQTELRREFPGIEQLPGLFHPRTAGFDGLRMVVKTVAWTPMSRTSQLGGVPSHVSLPELEITGADDDYRWLLDSLRRGDIPLQRLPTLPELPFVRAPFKICLSEGASPTMEVFEKKMSEPEIKQLVQSLMGCYRRKSEVREERMNLGSHTRQGVRFDTNRLVEAVVSSRVGLEPRLFRRKAGVVEPVFNPQEHLVVIAVDLNDLRKTENWWEDETASIQRFLSCIIMAYQKLEVDCVVLGFADRLVTLDDGRTVCLHWSTELKSVDQAFDLAFWNRVTHLFDHPPQFPGETACYHPLSLLDVSRIYDRTARTRDHSYRALVWWARHGLPHSAEHLRSDDFLARAADYIDREIVELGRRHAGTLDTLASFLPADLKSHGRPGGYLQSIQMGKED